MHDHKCKKLLLNRNHALLLGWLMKCIASDPPLHAAEILPGEMRGGWEATVTENNRVTTVFRGKEANGNQIHGLTIQFNDKNTDPKPAFFVESPECEMEPGTYNASSNVSIKLMTADMGFVIEGVGWMWDQRQSLLLISNKVSTVIRRDLINPQQPGETRRGQPDNATVRIHADFFSFHRTTSKAVYRHNVTASDPGHIQLASGRLQIDLKEGTGGLREVLADHAVELKMLDAQIPVEAKGGRAIYKLEDTSEGVVELLDAPTWSAPGYKGGGDRIEVSELKLQQQFKVIGNTWASLDPGRVRQEEVKNISPKLASIEITSEKYSFDGSEVRFEGQVEAGQKDLWKLQCAELTAGIDARSRRVMGIDAKGQVRFSQIKNGKRLDSTADHVLYHPTSLGKESIVLSGNAQVAGHEYMASGRNIEMTNNGQKQGMRVTGNAVMDLALAMASRLGIPHPAPSMQTTHEGESPQRLRITSNAYFFEDDKIIFKDRVRVQFEDADLTCTFLQVILSQDRKWIRSMIAQDKVLMKSIQGQLTCDRIEGFFTQENPQMKRMDAIGNVRLSHGMGKARSERASFFPQKEMVELSGTPQIIATLPVPGSPTQRHILAEGGQLFWNLARERLNGRGNYRISTIDNPDLW